MKFPVASEAFKNVRSVKHISEVTWNEVFKKSVEKYGPLSEREITLLKRATFATVCTILHTIPAVVADISTDPEVIRAWQEITDYMEEMIKEEG